MVVVVPEALRSKLHPRRSLPDSAEPPARNGVALLAKKLKKPSSRLPVLRKGVDAEVAPELAPLRQAAFALLENPSLQALQSATLEELAAFVCMARGLDGTVPLSAAVLEARGLSQLLEIEWRCLQLMLDAPSGGWGTIIYLVRGRPRFGRNDVAWQELRHALCAAPEAAYLAAREFAERQRVEATLLDRAELAFAFPDEAWGNDDLRACLADASLEPPRYAMLLSATNDPSLVREFVNRAPKSLPNYAYDLAISLPRPDTLEILGSALPSLLKKPKYGPLLKTPPRDVAGAIATIKTRAAAELLAPYAGNAALAAQVADFFQSAPELADVLLSSATGKAARSVAERVVQQVSAREKLDEGPVASLEQVPRLLVECPWRARRGQAKPQVIEGVATPTDIAERVLLPPPGASPNAHRDMTVDEVEAHLARAKEHRVSADSSYQRLPAGGLEHVRVPPELGLQLWNQQKAYLFAGPLEFLSQHGLAALPGFLANSPLSHLDYEGADAHLQALSAIESPRIAPLFARIAARRKHHRGAAYAWLKRHAALAARGLIPVAVGPLGRERDEAEAALLYLNAQGAAAVREALTQFSPDVRAIVEGLLARDPLVIAVQPPKLPPFLRAADLPALRRVDGARLPDSARDALIELLSAVPLDNGYPGFVQLQSELDAASAAAFAGALLEQWLLAGGNGRFEWMLHGVARFPSVETTRRLALLARDWARRDRSKAERACATLAAIASDLALLHLGQIAETSRFQELRESVRSALDEAASARGLTRDELEDRTVPDLGLDDDGKLRLSFGARSFVASLDASLTVCVRDPDGKLLRAAPRKTSQDDPALAKAALERLKQLKSDAESIAARQIRRLERAMVVGRSFSAVDFRMRIAAHPVMMHLARALLWEALDEAGAASAFRIAEDGSFAGVTDSTFTIESDARVRLLHPVHSRTQTLGAWTTLFSDYQVIQPFEQLARACYACSDAERGLSSSARVSGVVVDATRLLGLMESRGYERNDRGMVSAYLRHITTASGSVLAQLGFSPGIEIAYLSQGSPQTLGQLELSKGGSPVTFAELDAVAYSELMRDLEQLRA
ncbi:MAG: DUF4132 domain-containing protein [Polyangiaceae bacterium]